MPIFADILLVITGGLAAGVAYVALRNRPRAGTGTLSVLMILLALWSLIHLIEHHTSGLVAVGLAKLKFTVLAPAAFVWFAFVLAYIGRGDWLTRRTGAVLFAWPVLIGVLVWIPEGTQIPLQIWGPMQAEQGIVYWTHIGLSFGLLALGSGAILLHVVTAEGLFRRQGLAVLGALLAAWLGAIVGVFELFGDLHLHSIPIGMSIMGGLLLWAVTTTGLTRIAPIANRQILQTLDAGVISLDVERRVISTNPAARDLLGIRADQVAGQAVDSVLPESPKVQWIESWDSETGATSDTFDLDDVHVRAELTPLTSDRGRVFGLVLLIHDVTEQHRRQVELERQHERLEQHSQMVSHDLRSPLTVAKGRIDLERNERETENLETAARALDRMDTMIGELHTLAQSGQYIEETETVSLADVCWGCWKVVESADADLTINADTQLQADGDRLRHLLENLFGNAVEHGGPDVSIEVGVIDNGFYVADDGPGIPPSERTDVFEPGVSMADDGSGLGLAIVKEAAEAHGWDVGVTESAAGGARFEITGVS